MCKVIDSEIVIGNFLIEAAKENKFQIKIDQLLEFNNILSKELANLNTFTSISYYLIRDFVESYPFLVKEVDDARIELKSHDNKTVNSLTRHFRYGVKNQIVERMETSYKKMGGKYFEDQNS